MISVENLSKCYLVGHQSSERERYTALRDVITRGARNFVHRTRDLAQGRQLLAGDQVEEFWALRDVSFKVEQGEVLGIIGRNGAGKSTLLKILSRITEPTRGRVVLDGRVASLLEVGTGFHPELTGRENIFLNGAVLGMTRHEIRTKFDEIVEFAGVAQFLDTPVKRYSSGMYVRLAFAVAAHLEPEILVVDEVLAVGDAEFQKKCLGKMGEVARGGRTVLFVSHNMGAVRALCKTAIVLAKGSATTKTPVNEAIALYLRSHHDYARETKETRLDDVASLTNFSFQCAESKQGIDIEFEIVITTNKSEQIIESAVLIYNTLGIRVGIIDLREDGSPIRLNSGDAVHFNGKIRKPSLVEGIYDIGFYYYSSRSRSDHFNLTTISVPERDQNIGPTPFLPSDRGLVDFEFTASREIKKHLSV